jgi:hypothetical protein
MVLDWLMHAAVHLTKLFLITESEILSQYSREPCVDTVVLVVVVVVVVVVNCCFHFSGVGNVTAATEFNFCCDAEAAHIVIQNMKCPITIFSWEAAYKYGRIPYVSNFD